MLDKDVRAVQTCYPKIYLACHTRHKRAVSDRDRLSSHDASVLSHLSSERGTSSSKLASHLGVRASTLSATLERLERLGCLERRRQERDRRRIDVFLTKKGSRAVSESSVLDTALVREVLKRLGREERHRAVAGLELLAKASESFMEDGGPARSL